MRVSSCVLSSVALLGSWLVGDVAHAEAIRVDNSADLARAIAEAQPGDELVLADGTYRLSGSNCAAVGTAGAPIVVRAETPLGAVIEFDGAEGFRVSGAHWHFEGLDIVGVCADPAACEHAFHVTGAADGFVLRKSRVRDFNAQLKVNAAQVDRVWTQPNDGIVEGSEFFDAAPRPTSNPVTKLNIDTGRGWIVRDNYLHDFGKAGGDGVSYGAFMKSGGEGGLFERNLVVCTTGDDASDTRIGLSFGGGGTGAAYCAPAFDPNVPCEVEHRGGTMRNNIVAGCSDVGIYLNRAADTELLFNTLIGTSGIDFRFGTTSGVAHGNLLSGRIRDRDGATHTEESNLASVTFEDFASWYEDPTRGDLRLQGDVSPLIGKATPHADMADDYCIRERPAEPTYGALEHALGDCATVPPPGPIDPGAGGSGGAGGSSGGGGTTNDSVDDDGGGCGCASSGRAPGAGDALLAIGLGAALLRGATRRRHGS